MFPIAPPLLARPLCKHSFGLEHHSQRRLVPASAPQMSAKGSFVYVVKQDSTAEQRAVSLGQRQGDLIVVESGVAAGEQVVINGQLGVTPGGKVLIEQPREAGAPAGSSGGSK